MTHSTLVSRISHLFFKIDEITEMMEALYDPLDSLFAGETLTSTPNDFLFTEQPIFDECSFDPTVDLPSNPGRSFPPSHREESSLDFLSPQS